MRSDEIAALEIEHSVLDNHEHPWPPQQRLSAVSNPQGQGKEPILLINHQRLWYLFILVQCDEARPTCLRCQKAGDACQYRDQFDMFVRDQTVAAARRAKQKWRARSAQIQRNQKPASSPKSSRISSQEMSGSDERYVMAIPAVALNVPLVDQAVNRFFYDFVCGQASQGKVQGFLSFLPDSFKDTPPDCLLHNAVLAVAFANYQGRRRSGLEGADSAKTHYGKALLGLKDVLEDPTLSSNSDTLLAIYILSMFEVLSFPKYNRGSWALHTAGAVALLRARNASEMPNSLLRKRLSRKIMWTMVCTFS